MPKKHSDEFIEKCYKWYCENESRTIKETANKWEIPVSTLTHRFQELEFATKHAASKSRRESAGYCQGNKNGKIFLTARRLMFLRFMADTLLEDWKIHDGALSKFCKNNDDEIELSTTLEWLFQYIEARENETERRIRKQ